LSYAKGRKVEYKCRSILEGLGVGLIARSAGSRGPADLIAFFPVKKEIWLIQVKAWNKPPSHSKLVKDYGTLKDLEGSYTVKSMVYVKRGRVYSFEAI
jgi:hypothetical protein